MSVLFDIFISLPHTHLSCFVRIIPGCCGAAALDKKQSYLTESRFRPRKLKKDKKTGLVGTITAMEASYPADANPLGDPALSGQWSVVYSSSSKVSVFFQVQGPRSKP